VTSLRTRGLVLAAVALAAVSSCIGPGSRWTGPGGSRLTLEFEGLSSFGRRRLLEVLAPELEELGRRTSVGAVLDDLAFSVEEFYRSEGFPFVEVEPASEETEGSLRAVLHVTEGPRTRIESAQARVEGPAPGLDTGALAGFLGDPSGYFVERTLQDAPESIHAACTDAGFPEAVVSEPRAEFSPGRERVRLEIDVRPGRRHVLAAAPELAGGDPAIDARIDFADLVGRPWSPRSERSIRARIVDHYGRAGHPDVRASIEATRVEADGSVRVAVRVVPGELVRVGAVRVEGHERTREGFVLDLLELEPGDTYDARKERESARQLYRTGVFSSVRVGLVESTGTERTLLVELEEASRREFFVEPGYGSYERLRIVGGWRENNLFGTGRFLDFEGGYAQLARRAVLRVTDPRFLGSDWRSTLSLFASRREEPSFTSVETGGAIGFTRELAPNLQGSGIYQLKQSDAQDVDFTDPSIQAAVDKVDVSSVTAGATWSTRDSVVAPRRGVLAQSSVEVASEALASELDFVRFRFQSAVYHEISDSSVVGFSWRGGLIAATGDTGTIPVQERFFNGGDNSVRSFGQHELGPVDSSGNPVGGEAFHVVSLEYRRRLVGPLEGAVFVDTGNLLEDHTGFLEFRGMRHALGVGLRYLLPIGPVRLDVGWNPDPRGAEDDYAVHFSVGMPF